MTSRSHFLVSLIGLSGLLNNTACDAHSRPTSPGAEESAPPAHSAVGSEEEREPQTAEAAQVPSAGEPEGFRWQSLHLPSVGVRALFADGPAVEDVDTSVYPDYQLVSQYTPRSSRIIWRGAGASLESWQVSGVNPGEVTDRRDSTTALCGRPALQRELEVFFPGGDHAWLEGAAGHTVTQPRTIVKVARELRDGDESLLVVYIVPAEQREALREEEERYFNEVVCDPT